MAYPHVTISLDPVTPAEVTRQATRNWTWLALVLFVLAAPMPFKWNEFPAMGVGGLVLFNFGMVALLPVLLAAGEWGFVVQFHVIYALFWFLPCAGALLAALVAWRRTGAEAPAGRRAAVTLAGASLLVGIYEAVVYVWYVWA
jgi:hypothetical protein